MPESLYFTLLFITAVVSARFALDKLYKLDEKCDAGFWWIAAFAVGFTNTCVDIVDLVLKSLWGVN